VWLTYVALSLCCCACDTQEFGPEWAKEHLVPPVLAMVKNPHYLYRMTVLGAVAALSSYVSPDVLRGTMLPVVIQCAKDKVRGVVWGRTCMCACVYVCACVRACECALCESVRCKCWRQGVREGGSPRVAVTAVCM
jgi:hypothetical protein